MSLQVKDNLYSTDGGITWYPIERGTLQPLPEDGLIVTRWTNNSGSQEDVPMIARAVVANALAELRDEIAELVRQENEEYTERSALDAGRWALSSIDATIAALRLGA